MKILVGYVTQLDSSGVDKYLLNVLHAAQGCGVVLDFLTSQYNEDTERSLSERGSRLITIRSLKNPFGHYHDVKAVLQGGEYDKAYFNISEPLNMMGVKAAYDCGVPCVVHAHSSGMDISNKLNRFIRGSINAICRPFLSSYADLYIACSRKAGEWMYTRKILKSDRYHTIYNAVDANAFYFDSEIRAKMRKELGVGDDTIVVGHIGSYCYAKNNFFLVDVSRELAKICPNHVMLCIGDGNDYNAVQKYASELGTLEYMRFLGVHRDILSLLNAMDVFVLPSRFEGAPIAAVEAQVAEVSCIISDAVTEEVVISPNTIQLPIKSPKPWAEAIVEMSKRKKSKILPEMVEQYSFERQQEQIISLFLESDYL